jgi:hypothetical protein
MTFEVLPHPPHFPDLAPSDFHLFGPLKQFLRGRKFNLDDDVQPTVHELLKGQTQASKRWFPAGASALNCRGIMFNCKQILSSLSQ